MLELRPYTYNEFNSKELNYEFVILYSNESNLPYDILFDSIGSLRTNIDNPFVFVRVNNILIPILLNNKSLIKDFIHSDQILNFIVNNYNILMSHYNHEISDKELLNLIF